LFVFYDTETTGTNVSFDQILQFAAILTDDNFNVVDTIDTRCRILPWVVPAPGALRVTRMSPSKISDARLPSFYEMMCSVRSKLDTWSPSTYIGYNTFLFDEPLLQRAFWQALLPPYLTVTNGNSRADLLPMLRALSDLVPGAINFAQTDNGRLSFKLDATAPINGFNNNNAHNALGDVEATIFLCRLVKERVPDFWSAIISRASKKAASKLLNDEQPVLVADYQYQTGTSLWWCQRVDQSGAHDRTALLAKLDFDWRALGSGGQHENSGFALHHSKGLKQISLNKCPVMFSLAEAKDLFDISPAPELLEQGRVLRTNDEIRGLVVGLEKRAPLEPTRSSHLEMQIFDGFSNRRDQILMDRFHVSSPNQQANMVSQFSDRRLQMLAQRIVYVNAPDQLAASDRLRIEDAIVERICTDHNDKKLWRTLPGAKKELDELVRVEGPTDLSFEIANWMESRPLVLRSRPTE